MWSFGCKHSSTTVPTTVPTTVEPTLSFGKPQSMGGGVEAVTMPSPCCQRAVTAPSSCRQRAAGVSSPRRHHAGYREMGLVLTKAFTIVEATKEDLEASGKNLFRYPQARFHTPEDWGFGGFQPDSALFR